LKLLSTDPRTDRGALHAEVPSALEQNFQSDGKDDPVAVVLTDAGACEALGVGAHRLTFPPQAQPSQVRLDVHDSHVGLRVLIDRTEHNALSQSLNNLSIADVYADVVPAGGILA